MGKIFGSLCMALIIGLSWMSCKSGESKSAQQVPANMVSPEEFKKTTELMEIQLDEQLKRNPNSSMWHGQKAMILQYKGKMAEAENEFQLAVKLDPQYAYNYLSMGVFYQQLGKKDEAKKSFEKLVELRPKSPIPHIMYAQKYYEPNGMHQDALRECMIAQILVGSVPQSEQGLEPGVITGTGFSKDGVSKLCKQYREKAGISYWQERTMFKQVKQELANNRKQFPKIKPTDAKIVGFQNLKFGTPRNEIEAFAKGKAQNYSDDRSIIYMDKMFDREARIKIIFIAKKMYRVQADLSKITFSEH